MNQIYSAGKSSPSVDSSGALERLLRAVEPLSASDLREAKGGQNSIVTQYLNILEEAITTKALESEEALHVLREVVERHAQFILENVDELGFRKLKGTALHEAVTALRAAASFYKVPESLDLAVERGPSLANVRNEAPYAHSSPEKLSLERTQLITDISALETGYLTISLPPFLKTAARHSLVNTDTLLGKNRRGGVCHVEGGSFLKAHSVIPLEEVNLGVVAVEKRLRTRLFDAIRHAFLPSSSRSDYDSVAAIEILEGNSPPFCFSYRATGPNYVNTEGRPQTLKVDILLPGALAARLRAALFDPNEGNALFIRTLVAEVAIRTLIENSKGGRAVWNGTGTTNKLRPPYEEWERMKSQERALNGTTRLLPTMMACTVTS